MAITGHAPAHAVHLCRSPIASAQVKSAVLLAGLHAPRCHHRQRTRAVRDHTERMFRYFGVEVATEGGAQGSPYKKCASPGSRNSDRPAHHRAGRSVVGGFSRGGGAVIVPGSKILLPNVGINPLRTGLFHTLKEMGAQISFTNTREQTRASRWRTSKLSPPA